MKPDSEIMAAAQALAPDIVADRRLIHSQPETGYQEVKTAALVADRLRFLGIEVDTGVGGTGVVGLLKGAPPGKTVLLRADMDALPLQEMSEVEYASQTPGVMHACGHDGHTAMLLGAARVLSERKESIPGTVKFMFQPAEEGGFGAVKMIEDGLMENPKPDGVYALHVDALAYAGEVAIRAGATSAAADRFTVTIKGRGGHAARPQLTVDPIVIASHIVVGLQTVVSRGVAPQDEAVLTVGAIDGGTTENIIPDTARIRGTMRSYSPDVREFLRRRIPEISAGIAQAFGGEAEFELRPGYPSMVNDEAAVGRVRGVAQDLLGEGAAILKEPMMGAEDFSYLLEQAPGAMFFLGVRNRSWETPRPTHSSSFDMDEEALPLGTAVMAELALRFLRSE